MWGDSLIERIEKPLWGQKRQFDIISKKIVPVCMEVPKLFHLCRKFILSVIPICHLDKAHFLLPLPHMISKNILKLTLEDFKINPMKVQAENIRLNSYMADYIHSGQEVTLMVQKKDSDSYPDIRTNAFNMLTMFEHHGLLCCVSDPAISLEEILSILRRINKTLTDSFAWKVVEAIAKYILLNVTASDCILHTSMIKVTKLYTKVYVESSSSVTNKVKQMPPELVNGPFHQEKTLIWFLGVILTEMLPGISSYQSKQSFKNLMEKCLRPEPQNRPKVKFILELVKENICDSKKCYENGPIISYYKKNSRLNVL